MTIPVSSSDSTDGRRVDRLLGVPQTDEVAACFACGVGNEERRIRGDGRAPEEQTIKQRFSFIVSLSFVYL